MKTYTLKLTSGTTYKLYDGTTLVTDAELTTLFGSAGSAYFVFDFDGSTPTATTDLTITDSSDVTVITNTGLTGIAEGKNFKGEWSNSATAFDTFVALAGKTLDEAELGFLMGKIKEAYDMVEYPISADKRLAQIAWDIIGANEDGIKLVEVKNTTNSNLNIYLGQNTSAKQISVPYGTSAFILLTHRKQTMGMVAFTVGIMFKGADTYKVVDQDGSTNAGAYYRLPVSVYNALTATTTGYALDATQGKILADSIGDLTTLTTTAKTSAVAAINELVGLETLTGSAAPTTATEGKVGQLYLDTTNSDTYICTAIVPGTDPDPDTYTWEALGGGSGSGIPTDATFWGASYDSVNNRVNGDITFSDPNDSSLGLYWDNVGIYTDGRSGVTGNHALTFKTQGRVHTLGVSGLTLNSNYSGTPDGTINNVASPSTDYQAANKLYVDTQIADAALIGSTLSTPSSVAYVGTDNIQDGAVTADKMDLSTMGYNNTNAVVIGSFVDSNNISHTIYRKMYKFTNYTTNATDNYRQYQLDLANYTIVGSEVSLYRTDATGVINTSGTDLTAIFTGSGNYVRIYYYGGAAQTNATVYLTVDYMD